MSVCVSGEESVYSDDDDSEWDTLQKKLLQDISLSSACNDENCSEDEHGDESSMKCCSWMSQCKKNWTSVVAIVFLWTAYALSFAAYSTIATFFPQVVSILLSM